MATTNHTDTSAAVGPTAPAASGRTRPATRRWRARWAAGWWRQRSQLAAAIVWRLRVPELRARVLADDRGGRIGTYIDKYQNLRNSSETIMIGDTMETDILGGVQMGYRTILVLTGVSDLIAGLEPVPVPHGVGGPRLLRIAALREYEVARRQARDLKLVGTLVAPEPRHAVIDLILAGQPRRKAKRITLATKRCR